MSLSDFDFPGILTKVVAALVILVITFVIAKVIKTLLAKYLTKVSVLQRHDDNGQSLGESLGTIASLVVWLIGLIAVLNLFNLTSAVAPIQDLLTGVLSVLPGVLGAALVFFVGFVLAKIVRQIVETALRSAGADHWMERASGGSSSGTRTASASSTSTTSTTSTTSASDGSGSSTPSLSSLAGQLVFALIIVVVSISALQVLGIEAISAPATQMLSLILNAIPSIIAAALLLGIGYFIARLIAPLVESTLRGLGTDRALADLGLGANGGTTPSSVIAKIVQVAIVLFFAIAATRVLGFAEITAILDTILEIGGSILLGAAIIAVGVLIANLIPRFVSGQTGQAIRYAAIALFVAIGLRSMGLADSIINLAFGAIVIGAAAAAAIAFGLGGRDAAARQLEQLQSNRNAVGGSTGGPSTTSTASTSTSGGNPLDS